MSFVFRARRTGEAGSGGKIVRGRLLAVSPASPYHRPKSPLRSENPSWIFGATRRIATGAGKLLSSVFGSSSSPSTSPDTGSSYNFDDGHEDIDDRDDICSKEVEKLTQNVTANPIVQKSSAKLAIEQLIMLETFSRDECDKLTTMIKSRVIEDPTMRCADVGQDMPSDVHVGSDSALLGSWQSLPLTRRSPELFSSSARSLVAHSPGTFAPQSYSPDLQDTAIMEAKKWLEEKKLESTPNSKQDLGPSTLDTATLTHVMGGEVGSPVDMAKSYMQARPPWTSPTLSNLRFNTPPNLLHLYKDETPYSIINNSLPSTTGLKRNSVAIAPSDIIDETRRVRLKTVETVMEPPVLAHLDLSTRISENGVQNSSSAGARVVLVPNPTFVTSNENQDLEEEEASQAKDLEEAPQAMDLEKVLLTKDLKEATNAKDFEGAPETLDLEEALQAKDLGEALLTKDLEGAPQKKDLEAAPPTKSLEDAALVRNWEEAQLTKDLEEAPLAREQVGSSSDSSKQHQDLAEKLSSETKLRHVEETKCTIPSDAHGSTSPNDARTSCLHIGSVGEKVSQVENCSHSRQTYSIKGLSSVTVNDEEERYGLSKRVDANGSASAQPSSSAKLNVDLHPKASSNNHKNTSLGGLASGYIGESCELLSEASMDTPQNDEIMNMEGGLQANVRQLSEKAPKSKGRPNPIRTQLARGRSKGAQKGETEVRRSRRGWGRGK